MLGDVAEEVVARTVPASALSRASPRVMRSASGRSESESSVADGNGAAVERRLPATVR
ncbi:MAG: hypothetical protein ACKO0W_09800 [Planctomycetota bacterium]